MPNLVEIVPFVLEKMKMWKVYRGQTDGQTTGNQKSSRAFSSGEQTSLQTMGTYDPFG